MLRMRVKAKAKDKDKRKVRTLIFELYFILLFHMHIDDSAYSQNPQVFLYDAYL